LLNRIFLKTAIIHLKNYNVMIKHTTKILILPGILILIFITSFLVFYKLKENSSKTPLILTSRVIGQPLPKTNLSDIFGNIFDDENLRHGKFVLVFMMPDCDMCDVEDEFLKTVVGNHQDVSFIYVIPFGNKEKTLELAQNKSALKPYFDNGSMLSRKLELLQVPIKIFIEDGIIKQTWINASLTSEKQTEFKDWLQKNSRRHNE